MDNLTLAYLLILVGLALLVAEVFLPSFGLLTVLAVSAFIVAVALAFGVSTTAGYGAVVSLLVSVPLLGVLLYYVWPRTPIGRRFFLPAPDDDETMAHTPLNQELEQLRGRYGRSLSALRPSGVCEFDGRRVDTLSEGNLIEPGRWVQCIDVKAGRVVVREIDAPPDLEEIDTADLDGM